MNNGVYSMNKTMEMYSPSHKKRVMAEVIEGYAQNGKGGSPRLALKGLFEGKKTLPKKVDVETFEKYGFNAEQTIAAFHAEQVGEPLPESPLENAPSTVPSPVEPTNANFSAEDTYLQCWMGLPDEQGRYPHPHNAFTFEDLCPRCGAVEGDVSVQRITPSPHEQYLKARTNTKRQIDSMTEAEKEAYHKAMATFREVMKEAEEAVYIKGKNPKDPKQEAMFYQVGQEDLGGFIPEKIVPIRTMNERGRNKIVNAMKEAEEAVYIKGKNPKDPKQEAMFYQVGKEDDTGFTPEKIVPIRTMNERGRNKIVNAMKDAESAFDRLEDEVADEYEEKGMSDEKAKKIGAAVAYTQGVKKYGKKVMTEAAKKGVSAKSLTKNAESLVEEPDWIPDGDGRAFGQQNSAINLSPLHAESFNAESCNMCGGKPIYDKRFNEEWGDELAVCEECFNDAYGAESQNVQHFEACGICDKDFASETLNADGYCGSCCDSRLAEFDNRIDFSAETDDEPYYCMDCDDRQKLPVEEMCPKCLTEGQFYCWECCSRNEGDAHFSAESKGISKNAQIALGLTALGVGIAVWKSNDILNLFNKFRGE